MDAHKTPDAVREAKALEIARDLMVKHFGPGKSSAVPASWVIEAMLTFAALDSRAGYAGEGDRYTRGYAQGQADAAQLHQWMQDKAWQDTVLMLVHYQTLAERTWLVGHEAATAKLAEWWRHARALSETKSVDGIAATPAPAVDAMCPSSPDGRHQVDTSMESGPNNCFHCEAPMGGRHAR